MTDHHGDPADHWPAEVAIPGAQHHQLQAIRDRIARDLERHRGISTRDFSGHWHKGPDGHGYKNPTRLGYDLGLTKALEILDTALEQK